MPNAQHPAAIERSTLRAHWLLDPAITFLNHGSYGACPIPVLEAQRELRDRLEREPVRFFMRDLEGLLDAVRARIAPLCGCDEAGIGFAPNATIAIASVLHSIDWQPGDEILVTDQEYMSAVNEIRRLERRFGVRLVTAPIRFPDASDDQIVQSLLERVTDKTQLAIVSHITSPSALVLPVARIVEALGERGVAACIDGAHAPGQIAVDIEQLAPAYYIANLHKWVCAPKGAAFLWVSPQRRAQVRTLALSSRAHFERPDRAMFLRDFDYMGTDDPTAVLAAPAALDFMASLVPDGWDAIRAHNHDLVMRARDLICDATGLARAAPASMIGSMATIPLPPVPDRLKGQRTAFDDPLQDRLVAEHNIQVPVWSNDLTGQRYLRISAQVYNTLGEYRLLAEALKDELAREAS